MRVLIVFVLILTVLKVNTEHLVVGNVANRVVLENHTLVEYNAFPFMKRVKMFFYSTKNNKLIQGIQALDTLHSKASINITAGGVGHPFVNLRMKSERGSGLAYDIGIYVNPEYF